MANPNDNLRKLYQNGLKYYSLPDFDTFQQDMKDENKRRRFYTNMQEAYSLPDFDTFSQDIGAVAPTSPAQPTAQTQPQQPTVTPTVQPIKDTTAQQVTVERGTTSAQPAGWAPSPMQQRAFQMQMDEANARLKKQGEEFQQHMEGVKKGNKPGAFMGEREFNPATGEMGTAYYTTQGERVPTSMQQRKANSDYHQWWENNTEAGLRSKEQRLQREFDARLSGLWQRHNPTEGENAAEQAWSAAEVRQSAARNNNAKRHWDSYAAMGGGREMRVVTASMNHHDDMVAHFTNYDLDRLMNESWDNLGEDGQKALIDDCYQMLRYRNPGADELVLYNQAKEFARQQSDLRLYNLAVEKNLPKGNLEYLMRKIGDMNLLMNISKGLAVSSAKGKTGDMAAYEAANEQYRQDGHKVLDVTGMVAGFALDPTTWLSAGVGGAATKGAMWTGGRFLAGRGASSAVTQAATRQFATSMTGRIVGGIAGGAANFGTFEGVKEMENQFAHGGHIVGRDETGRYINEGYSAGAVGGQALHGLMMGGAVGWLGPVSGNVSDQLVRATSSTLGKVATRAGVYTGATIAEGTIFSVPEWIEGKRDAMDVWSDNMAMMIGFKAKHILKSTGGVLGDLKASFDSPTNGQKNRLDFESRLRQRMDAPSDGGMALTEDEKAELKRYGYDLRDLVESSERTGDAAEGSLIAQNAPEIVSRLTDMVNDPRVSEAARAKMYYYATGRRLPMSTVMKGELIEDGKGGFIVESQGANGVITSRSFKSRKAADLELERIKRQTELNTIEIGERYQQIVDVDNRMQEASRRVAAKYGWDPVEVYKTYETVRDNSFGRGESNELTDAQKNIYGKIISEFEQLKGNKDLATEKRNAINEKYGVDIDRAIRKEANRRTLQEQTAIDEYMEALIPSRAKSSFTGPKLLEGENLMQKVEDAEEVEATEMNDEHAARQADAESEPIDPRFDSSTDPAPDYDPHQPGGEQAPIGRAVMKYQDRPVEVLSGRVVMMEDGSMVDKELSDASIVIRDLASGKIEMIAPEEILSYEDYTAGAASMDADKSAVLGQKAEATEPMEGEWPKYTSGQIRVRNSDGSETRGWLTGYVDEDGKHEYYLEGDLRHLRYASEHDLDAIISEYIPDIAQEQNPETETFGEGTSDSLGNAGNSVTLERESQSEDYGNGSEQNNDVQEHSDGGGVAVDATGIVAPNRDRGDIRVYEEGLGTNPDGDSQLSERTRRNSEAERLINYGTRSEQNLGLSYGDGRHSDGSGVAVDATGVAQGAGDRGDIRVYEEGLGFAHDAHTDDSERNRREAESQRLVGIAKANRQYIPSSEFSKLGKRKRKNSGESIVYEDQDNNIVYKIKDPYAKSPMKSGVQPEDAIYEHLVHNKYFPETRYRFEGISDDFGDVRIVLSQNYVAAADNATDAQIEAALAEKGLYAQDRYTYGNDEVSVTDVTGDNALLGADGKVYFIDPIINFKKPVREILAAGEGTEAEASGLEQKDFSADKSAVLGQRTEVTEPTAGGDALERLPRNKNGEPVFEEADSPETAWDALVAFSEGDAVTAKEIADAMAEQKRKVFEKAQKQRPAGKTPSEILASKKAITATLAQAERDYNLWRQMANVEQRRQDAIRTQQEAESRRMAPERRAGTSDDSRGGRERGNRQSDRERERDLQKTETDNLNYRLSNEVDENGRQFVLNSKGELEFGRIGGETGLIPAPILLSEGIITNPVTNDGYGLLHIEARHGAEIRSAGYPSVLAFVEDVANRWEVIKEAKDRNGNQTYRLIAQGKHNHTLMVELSGDGTYWNINTAGVFKTSYGKKQKEVYVRHTTDKRLAEDVGESQISEQSGTTENSRMNSPALDRSESQNPNSSEWRLAEHPTDVPDLLTTQGKSDAKLETSAKTEPQQPNNAVSSDSSLSTDEQSGTSSIEPTGESTVSNRKDNISASEKQEDGAESFAQLLDNKGEQTIQAAVKAASAQVNTEPTPAQAEAGNYKKGHVTVGEFDITIENPAGSVRKGVDADGKGWSTKMANTYGYIKGTEGVDGDHIDVFLHSDMNQWNGRKVFVVDQTNTDGSFDEHKVMLGFNDNEEAMTAYLANYDKTWANTHPGLRISETNIEDFNKWVKSSHRKTKPFAEYSSIKNKDVTDADKSAPLEQRADATGGRAGTSETGQRRDGNRSFSIGEVSAPNRLAYEMAKEMLEQAGIVVHEVDAKEAQAMLGNKKTPVAGQPNRVNEKLTSGSVLLSAIGDSSSSANVPSEAIAKINKDTQKAKNNIKKFNNGDAVVNTSTVADAIRSIGSLLSMRSKGGSRYTVLRTDRGDTVAIRLSDHRANGNNFAKDEADRNLSVVIEKRRFDVPESEIEFTEAVIPAETFATDPESAVRGIIGGVGAVLSGGDFKLDSSLGSVEKRTDDKNLRSLKDSTGTVYGWSAKGEIYLNRDAMNPETPIHEYTHLWDEMVRRENPELWARGVELMKQTPIWEEVMNDPNYSDIHSDTDAVASEVHSRLTGRDGAKLLQEMIDKAKKEGLIETAKAVSLADRLKRWISDMFKALKKTFGKWSKRDLKNLTIEDYNRMAIRDLAEGLNPRHGDRTLAGVHNITEQKLMKALKIGGLVNPSVAVIDVNRGKHEGYGEISLVLPSSKIDRDNGNAGTWPGDAWTPTYPTVERRMAGEGADLPARDMAKMPEAMKEYVRRAFNGWLDGRGNEGMAYWFLHERGEAPDIVRRERIYTAQEASRILRNVKEKDVFGGLTRKPLSKLTDEERANVKEAYIKYKFNGSEAEYNEAVATRRGVWEKLINDYPEGSLRHSRGANNLAKLEKTGLLPEVESWLNEIQADIDAGNKQLPESTSLEANKIINERNLRGEFDKWVDSLTDRYGIEEVIFDGYTQSGNRRYVKNTAQNVSRLMREQGRNAATGWGSSFTRFVAAVMHHMPNREAIRKEKDRLTTDEDAVDAFDGKWQDVFFDLGMKCQPEATGRFDDYGLERLTEAVGHKNPVDYLKKEYGVELTTEDVMKLRAMIDTIRRERPAKYFETKFERPVQLEEFSAAVVPETIDPKLEKAIADAGLKVVKYDDKIEGDRQRALREASDDRNVRFHAAMSHRGSDFDAIRDRAVAERGIVMRGLNEAEVRIVYVPPHDFKGEKPIAAARRWAKDNIVGDHILIDSSGAEVPYTINGRTVDKYLSSSAIDKSKNLGVHLAVLKELPSVIENSIEAEVHPDYIKGADGQRRSENGYNDNKLTHRFYGAIAVGADNYRVKTTVVESRKPEDAITPHSFEVTEIELLPEDNSSKKLEPTAPDYQGPVAYGTAKLLKGVEKSYDPGKNLLDESERSVDSTEDDISGEGDRRFREAETEAEASGLEQKDFLDKVELTGEHEDVRNILSDEDAAKLDDESRAAVEDYVRKYPCAPIKVIAGEADIDALDHPEVSKMELRTAYNEGDTIALFNNIDKKIYIFANRSDIIPVGESLLHENLHKIVDSIGPECGAFLDAFAIQLKDSQYNNGVFGKLYYGIADNEYYQKVNEEFLAYSLQYSLRYPAVMTAIKRSLDNETLRYLETNILDRLYERKEGLDKRAGERPDGAWMDNALPGVSSQNNETDGRASQRRDASTSGWDSKGKPEILARTERQEGQKNDSVDDSTDRGKAVGSGNLNFNRNSGNVRSEELETRAQELAERINAHQQEMAQTSPEAKSSHAEKLAKKFNTPIQIVTDTNELTSDNAERQARMRRSKGFYDPATGKVVVVLPNNANIEDVAETLFHEVVAHKGLREMIGEENYDAFCDEVYDHLKDDLKEDVDRETTRRFEREPEKGYEHHRRVSVDEMFGRIAEKGFEDFTKAERGIWAKLKAKVLEVINKFLGSLKLPKWITLGDNELRYMLWRSYEKLRTKGDYVDMARDAAKREALGLNRTDIRVTSSKRTTADRIEESFNATVSGELKGKPIEIGRLTEDGRAYLEKLSGMTMKENVSFVLNPSDLAHIYRRHFGKNEGDSRNIPLTKEDIRQMAEIVSNPSRVIFGKEKSGNQRNMFFFLKEAEDGSYNLMEVYSDRKGNLTAKSFFKSKEGVSQRAMLLNESSTLTSVTDGATLSDSAKLPKFFENPTIGEEESFVFRDGETGDIWKDQSIGLEERMTNAAIRLSNNHSGDLTLRNDAQKAVVNNLQSLLHSMRNRRGTAQSFTGADRKVEAGVVDAMNAQAMFDRATVKRVSDLARILMQNGYLSGMTSGEMQRLLSVVKNATAIHDISGSVQKIMDIMVNNQLRNAEGALRQLLSIRGSKVDARGVEVQGSLDVDGQRTMEVVKKAMSLSEDDINDRIAEALNRMSDSDQTIADQAALEYAGLNMALDYVQNIANSRAEEKALRDELKLAQEDKNAGRMTADAYKQFDETTKDAISKNKIERTEAYFNLVGRLSDSMRGSIENAKAFRETEKIRVSEIHHNANSDMEGRPTNEHHKDDWKDKFVNNGLVQFLFAPLGTFDQILRVFGNKSANGEGYLWNRFMRGWVDCRNKELSGVKEKFARLDEKVEEIFAKAQNGHKKKGVGKIRSIGDVIRLEGKLPKVPVSFWDGGEMRDHELTQGNLLYIYMVDKMTDGRMKLRRMGITEDDITNIENFLDPRFKAFGDWLQDEFLVDTRNEYNETHKRMFGASMAAIENYFPLKILPNARIDKEEDVNQQNRPEGITTKTGSIIKRRVNNLALDVTGADALSVVLDHITQMEHWNAYAEWNRDLNTLRTYKRFRNQVINMTTVYGGGRKLWENFNDLCLMAAGEYRPPVSKFNKSAVNLAKGVTVAKVSFRMFTALKQFLSAPAYIPEISTGAIAKSIANPYGDFKWCLENMPIFRERWQSRFSGDPRLLKSDMDWKMWRSRVMELSSRIGMTPNAFVDAVTVSIGARAMYETRLKQYLKESYPADVAEKRAMQDAAILFNQTQQSSESPFMSTMQVDKDWLSTVFTVFRNSSMSYTRQQYDAMRNLKRNLTPSQRARSVEFMTKQILRDWAVDPDNASDAEYNKAESAAEKRFYRQIRKDVVRLATFGFILELLWNLGAYLPYILFGDDDDEKNKMWDDALTHAFFGSVEGLSGGDVLSSFGNMAASGEWNWKQLSKDMPLASDVNTIANKFVGKKNAEAINDIINLAVQMGIGMNPQSITDAVVAIMDACGDDPALSHEAAIFVMRVLQVPQSQIDKIYFDEIGLSGEEASKLTPSQLAQRYAEYKVKRGTTFAPWSWDDEERLGKHKKTAEKRIKERFAAQGDTKVNEAYSDFEARYKAVSQQVKEAKELMKADYAAAAQAHAALQQHPDFSIYQRFGVLDKQLGRMSKMWLTAKTPEEAALVASAISSYRAGMVKVLQAESVESQQSAMSELSALVNDFNSSYQAMQPAGGR